MRAVFVDSNILIYSQDATDPQKQSRPWTGLKFSGGRGPGKSVSRSFAKSM